MADCLTKIDSVLRFLGLLSSQMNIDSTEFKRDYATFEVLNAGSSAGFNQFTDALIDEAKAITEKLHKQEEKIIKDCMNPDNYEIVLGKWDYAVMSYCSLDIERAAYEEGIKGWYGKARTYYVVRDINFERFCCFSRKEGL